MEHLRYYPTLEIEGAAASLIQKLNDGKIGLLDLISCLTYFRFRDPAGKYWLLDALRNHWCCFDQDSWNLNDSRPDKLLGLERLSENLIQYNKTKNMLEEQTLDPVEFLSLSPANAYERIIMAVADSFQKGQMSSVEVEDFLGGQYIFDDQGRLWAMGLNSRTWYCFDGGSWQARAALPEINTMPKPPRENITCESCGHTFRQGARCPKCGSILNNEQFEKELQANTRLLEFLLSRSDLTPEKIVDPWDPPPGYPPELDLRCPSCQASNLPGSRHCRACGALLVCPNCGAENRPNSRFCRMCGQRLVA
jgi:hypothetical protein